MMHSLPRRLASALATTIVLLVLAVPAVASAHAGPSVMPPTSNNVSTSAQPGSSDTVIQICTSYPNGIFVCSSPASPPVSYNVSTSAQPGGSHTVVQICTRYPSGIFVCASPGFTSLRR